MKEYSRIVITGSPAFVKRFGRWLKNRYNVIYPDYEMRFEKLGIITVRWTIKYHDNWFLGSSENKLNTIASAAATEHARHTKDSHATSWDVYSE